MRNVHRCEACGGYGIEQVTSGQRVSDVVSVSCDDGLVCNLVTFIPQENEYATFYRCKNCHAILPFPSTKFLIAFLKGECCEQRDYSVNHRP